MSRFFDIIIEVTTDAFNHFAYFVENNLMNFAKAMNFILPFAMYFIGQYVSKGKLSIGWEICIPLVFAVVIYYLKSAANKIGKGITVPIPEKRFTSVDEDGEVSVDYNRIQELLLYLADLEDWFERKGISK